jgi:HK97 family phage prohead protease
MSTQREVRFIHGTELRAGGGTNKNDAPPYLEGYASVANSTSQNLGGFKERIRPGTFARSLREKADVRFLYNHNADAGVLGRTKSGTLALTEDEHGLAFRCEIPDTQMARDLHTSIKRGDCDSCSFAFQVAPGGESWSEEMDEETNSLIPMRTLSDVDLIECSAVLWPAYTATSVAARSGGAKNETRSMENTTMQNFSEEQRHFLSGACAAGFAEIPVGCPPELRNKIIETRAAKLGVTPAGKPATESQPINAELADELAALKSL